MSRRRDKVFQPWSDTCLLTNAVRNPWPKRCLKTCGMKRIEGRIFRIFEFVERKGKVLIFIEILLTRGRGEFSREGFSLRINYRGREMPLGWYYSPDLSPFQIRPSKSLVTRLRPVSNRVKHESFTRDYSCSQLTITEFDYPPWPGPRKVASSPSRETHFQTLDRIKTRIFPSLQLFKWLSLFLFNVTLSRKLVSNSLRKKKKVQGNVPREENGKIGESLFARKRSSESRPDARHRH